MGESNPLIHSGPNKGRIRDPLVTHEVYNRVREGWQREKKKPPIGNYFEVQGTNDLLIKEAAKTVRLEEEQTIDNLTGLKAGIAYQPTVEEIIRKGEYTSLGIIRFDLDLFSWVNDVLEAHCIGSIYLQTAGQLISKQLRRSKDIGFRVGGDEFAIVITDSFTPESFNRIGQRIHQALNKTILPETLKLLLQGERQIVIGEGKTEREGTIALKQFLTGFRQLKEDKEGRRKHFLNHGRGNQDKKKALLNLLDKADLSNFDEYLKDNRTYNNLTTEEREKRKEKENEIVLLAGEIFSNLSISTGGVYANKNDFPSFDSLDKNSDALVNEVKRKGGGNYIMKKQNG